MPVAFPSGLKVAHACRLVITGAAVVGAGLFALDAPILAGPVAQQHEVRLVDAEPLPEIDWATFVSNTTTNLANLQEQGTTASAQLTEALTNVSDHFTNQITTALTGFDKGIENALFGGWYGGDDGYVFGLFGGEPVLGGPTPGITGSLLETLADDLQGGKTQLLYSDLNAYSLELLDHTLKPLLSPLLDETTKGVTTYSIPVELSQIQTNLLQTFGTYNELKEVAQTLLSPGISANFALTGDIQNISAELANAGTAAQGLSDLNNLGSDVLNAFVNGYDLGSNPFNGAAELFPGLLTSTGADLGFLGEAYTTWTTQFIDALGALADPVGASASEAVGTSLPDLFSGLLSF